MVPRMAPLVDTKVGRSLFGLMFPYQLDLNVETCALREQKTPLGLPCDCLPRLSSGVRVSNRFRVLVKS